MGMMTGMSREDERLPKSNPMAPVNLIGGKGGGQNQRAIPAADYPLQICELIERASKQLSDDEWDDLLNRIDETVDQCDEDRERKGEGHEPQG